MSSLRFSLTVYLTLATSMIFADGPVDNQAASVRPVPPPGISIDSEVRTSLQQELLALKDQIGELRKSKSAIIQRYLPDVEVFAGLLSWRSMRMDSLRPGMYKVQS